MDEVIEVNSVSKKFGRIQVVQDLSFTVRRGEIYGFLGRNGAGKSTTIRMLLSLVKPDSGEIRIFRRSLPSGGAGILRLTGAVIERPDLYTYLSAREHLQIFSRLQGLKLDNKAIARKLAEVGLEARARDPVSTYSLGMKQRLSLAVAMVHDPELIILDEPTNGLDPAGIADIRNLIRQFREEKGKTVFVSSHLLAEVEKVATRVLVMDKGRKLIEGSANELFDPEQLTVEMETTDNERSQNLLRDHTVLVRKMEQGRHSLRVVTNKTGLPRLSAILSEHGIGILRFEPLRSLEALFLSLTNEVSDVEPVGD